jgi:hypothetical protein
MIAALSELKHTQGGGNGGNSAEIQENQVVTVRFRLTLVTTGNST